LAGRLLISSHHLSDFSDDIWVLLLSLGEDL
jgi:hypothetical protein